jgi:hypothetical protein
MQSFVWPVSVLVLIMLSTFVLWMSTLAQTPAELAGSWSVSLTSVAPGQKAMAEKAEGRSAMITVNQAYPSWPLQLTNERNQTTWGKLEGRHIATTQAKDLPDTPHWSEPGLTGTLSKDPATGQYVITWAPTKAELQSIWRKQGPLAALPPGTAGK